MTDAERGKRIGHALLSELGNELHWFWLSFCDPDKPQGSQFLGACIVRAEGPANALAESHRAKCNPGGEVQIMQLPPDLPDSSTAKQSRRPPPR